MPPVTVLKPTPRTIVVLLPSPDRPIFIATQGHGAALHPLPPPCPNPRRCCWSRLVWEVWWQPGNGRGASKWGWSDRKDRRGRLGDTAPAPPDPPPHVQETSLSSFFFLAIESPSGLKWSGSRGSVMNPGYQTTLQRVSVS